MKICYVPRAFSRDVRIVLEQANDIIATYQADGYDLSLRQLYYQFVSRDLIPNSDREYKRLGSIINSGRLAGEIDWDAIKDRGRNLSGTFGEDHPVDAYVRGIAQWYSRDRWKGQGSRPEIWVEKDALSGVIGRVAEELDVPYIACKGYMSQSEMWEAGNRMMGYRDGGQDPVVIHLGDHDPSGIDMTRDIQERLEMFSEGPVEVLRIALTMEQVNLYNPPPNPSKQTDPRSDSYTSVYGFESWELDALEPSVLAQLCTDAILPLRDDDVLDEVKAEEEEAKAKVLRVGNNWERVLAFLEESA